MSVKSAHQEHSEDIHDPIELLQEQLLKMEKSMSTVSNRGCEKRASGPSLSPMCRGYLLAVCIDSHKHQMTGNIVVGVLALQGAFYEHFKLLRKASPEVAIGHDGNWEFMEVRTTQDLEKCDALIIPGGESTTVSLVAARSNLLEPLRNFVKQVHPSENLCDLNNR